MFYFNKAWETDSENYCDTLYSLLCVYKKLGEQEKVIAVCKKWIKWYEDRGAIIEIKMVDRELDELQ